MLPWMTPQSMLFDGHGFVATRPLGDCIDGYLFTYGHDFKGAMKSFYAISGHQSVAPRWCLEIGGADTTVTATLSI
jgi:hypothetical protein